VYDTLDGTAQGMVSGGSFVMFSDRTGYQPGAAGFIAYNAGELNPEAGGVCMDVTPAEDVPGLAGGLLLSETRDTLNYLKVSFEGAGSVRYEKSAAGEVDAVTAASSPWTAGEWRVIDARWGAPNQILKVGGVESEDENTLGVGTLAGAVMLGSDGVSDAADFVINEIALCTQTTSTTTTSTTTLTCADYCIMASLEGGECRPLAPEE